MEAKPGNLFEHQAPSGSLLKQNQFFGMGCTMRFISLLKIFILLLSAASVLASEGDGPPPLMVVIQQDLQPQVNEKNFDDGFHVFLKEYLPQRDLEIYVFGENSIRMLHAGRGADIQWPSAQFAFTQKSAATRPYAALLSLLKARRTSRQTVLFISNGSAGGMNSPAQMPFALTQLVDYCEAHKVRLVGVYADDFTPVASLRQARYQDATAICSARNLSQTSRQLYHASREGMQQETTTCDWFREAMHATAGEIYYKYDAYRDVFTEIANKEKF
jgi:hypothetical protein